NDVPTRPHHDSRPKEYGVITAKVRDTFVSESSPSILLVGAGVAGNTHLRVLEDIPHVSVVAAVDKQQSHSATFRGAGIPLYYSLLEASQDHQPDIVVIATPTPTHAEVCDEESEHLPSSSILVEKPAADNFHDAQRLLSRRGGRRPISVALHMAFAPEVTWAASIVHDDVDLGAPVSIRSLAADPYQADMTSAISRLCTSWIDSGINCLS